VNRGCASLSKLGLLWFPGQVGIGQRTVEFLLPLVALLVHDAGTGFHFCLGFRSAPQALQNLPADIMDGVISRVLPGRRINFAQRFGVLSFPFVHPRQLKVRTGETGIKGERTPQVLLGFLILLLQEIHQAELVVVVGDVGLDRDVFQKFCPRLIKVLFLQVGLAQIKVNKRKFGIGLSRELQLLNGVVVFLSFQVAFPHQQMHRRRVLADFRHPA